jgi:hypothetical protein
LAGLEDEVDAGEGPTVRDGGLTQLAMKLGSDPSEVLRRMMKDKLEGRG